MQHVILISQRCKVWKISDKCVLLYGERERVIYSKGNGQIKTLGSSPTRVLLFLSSIFMVIYHRLYKAPRSIQLLTDTERQGEAGGDFRTIAVIQQCQESRCQAYAPTRGDLKCHGKLDTRALCSLRLKWKKKAKRCLLNFLFCYTYTHVCVCVPRSSILSDMFNRALAALTGGVNVSYFIRNPKEEG